MVELWLLQWLLVTIRLAGASNCRQGPSYWCESEDSALECRQTRYCQDNVWKTREKVGGAATLESLMGDYDCELCQLIVKFARDKVPRNSTLDEAEHVAVCFCEGLGSLSGECQDVVETYFPRLWHELMLGAMDPPTICTDSAVCSICINSTATVNMQLVRVSSRAKSLECKTCKFLAGKLMALLRDSNTAQEITKEDVMESCKYAGGFASLCRALMDKEWPEIYVNLLDTMAKPEMLCSFLKLCSDEK